MRRAVSGLMIVVLIVALLPFTISRAQADPEVQIAWSGLATPIALRLPGGVPPYTPAIDAPPAHGTLEVVSETVLLYTAAAGYTGPDVFTYTLADAVGKQHTATVAITVVSPGAGITADRTDATATDPATTDALTTTPPAEITVANTFVVRYAPDAAPAEIAALVASYGGEIVRTLPQIHALVIRVDEAARVQALAEADAVQALEPDLIRYPMVIPTDPDRSNQWALNTLHLYDAWEISKGTGEIIGVLDSGIDLNHPDLGAHLLSGYDFVGNDTDPSPDAGETHGSHVMGIANAVTDNGTGVAGVAWDARTLPVRVVNSGGGASSSDIAAGIIYAADSGAKVINLSLGGPGWVSVERDAVLYAAARGALIVASAGNDNSDTPNYPASYDHVLSVASTTSTNARSSFSNFGMFVDIAAPGSGIYSTIYNDGYAYKSGTSMASPAVAGVAALVRAGGVTDLDDLNAALLCTALDLGDAGRDDRFGWGLIQADQAAAYTPGTTCLPVVTHDDRASARLINSSNYSDTLDITTATGWETDPDLTTLTGTDCAIIPHTFRTVWYRYEPFAEGILEIDTVGSSYDTVLAAFTASGETLTPLGCNDDLDGFSDQSSLEIGVVTGQTVYVMVAARTYEDDFGTLALSSRYISAGVSGCAPLPSNPSIIVCTTG